MIFLLSALRISLFAFDLRVLIFSSNELTIFYMHSFIFCILLNARCEACILTWSLLYDRLLLCRVSLLVFHFSFWAQNSLVALPYWLWEHHCPDFLVGSVYSELPSHFCDGFSAVFPKPVSASCVAVKSNLLQASCCQILLVLNTIHAQIWDNVGVRQDQSLNGHATIVAESCWISMACWSQSIVSPVAMETTQIHPRLYWNSDRTHHLRPESKLCKIMSY